MEDESQITSMRMSRFPNGVHVGVHLLQRADQEREVTLTVLVTHPSGSHLVYKVGKTYKGLGSWTLK
jgi:hypothetical protein